MYAINSRCCRKFKKKVGNLGKEIIFFFTVENRTPCLREASRNGSGKLWKRMMLMSGKIELSNSTKVSSLN